MSTADPKRTFAVEVVRRLRSAGFQALWAGGCVRDYLLGRDPDDYDVATDATPDQVRQVFGRRRTLAVGASFGVIVVLAPDKVAGAVEVATFRTEGPYLDGRRPAEVRFSSPMQDALRRDFTINGMFYDPIEHRVFDYVGGEQDLGARIIRAIGDARARMQEDKLRLLRTVRFAAALNFEIDDETAAAVWELAPEIRIVSAERIAQELRRMLVHPNRARGVRLMHELGLLAAIFPELLPLTGDMPPPGTRHGWAQMLAMLDTLEHPAFELALAVLLHEIPRLAGAAGGADGTIPAEAVREICRRLRLSNHETDDTCWLVTHQSCLESAPELPLAQRKRLLAHRLSRALLAFHRAAVLAVGGDLSAVAFCDDYLAATPAEVLDPPPLLTGADLIARGLRPGPAFGRLLDQIRDAQLNEEIRTLDEALALLDRLSPPAADDKTGA